MLTKYSRKDFLMRLTFFNSFIFLTVSFGLVLIIGCGSDHSHEKAKAGDTHGHEHDKKDNKKEAKHEDKHDHDHGHEHEAPNGGALVELGEEFAHLELVNDATNNKITCYVLDGDLKTGIKAQQPTIIAQVKGLDESHNLTFKATVNELASNTAESSSQYESEFKFEKGKAVTLIIKKVTLKSKTFENLEVTLKEVK
jgi:preprotein translocase subunit SecG